MSGCRKLFQLGSIALLGSIFIFTPLCRAEENNTMNSTQISDSAPAAPQKIVSRQAYPNDITVAKLENGLTIIVQENHTAPVATVRCSVKNTGSINESQYLGAGLSHVLEHVVAGGSTTKRTEDEIRTLIDTFGGVSNAYTSLDVTSYFIDCPVKNVEMCIELISDQMQHAAFVPKEFDRELEVVQRELADGEESRARVMWKMMQQTFYQVHPASVPIIGYLDVLRQVKREQIIDFYRTRYIPNNMCFVVAGDVETEKVLTQLAQEFAGTPRGFESNVVLAPEPAQIAPREAEREMDGKMTDILLAFPTVDLYQKDLFTLDLLSYILSEGDSSRMVRDMQYDRSLVLSVGTTSSTPSYATGYFAVRMSVEPKNEKAAIDAALEHLYRLKTELVSDEELEKAKKQKASELIFDRQTVQQQAESLTQSYMSTGSPMFDELYVEGLQKVTAQQIQDAAVRYFRPEVLTTIKIVPKETISKQESKSETETEEAQKTVQVVTLENGLRVLVKRDTHLPIVDVKICTLGGNLYDTTETAGRSLFVSAMLDKGTPTRSAEEITNWFDSVGGYFAFSSGRNTLSGGFAVLSDDYSQALEILSDCWKNASFPEEKFEQVRTIILGGIAQRSSNPQTELFDELCKALPETTPYHIQGDGTVESITSMTPEALRDFYRSSILDPENMILTIYGDMNEEEAINLAKRYFGDIAKSANHQPTNFARPNTIPENLAIHKVTQKETGMVLICYAAPSLILGDKELPAMTLLNAVVGGYGYPGGWLHEELRGEGLVYSVHCLTRSGIVPGYMFFIAQTSPDKVDEVTARLFKNIAKARDGQITQEEFDIAKQKLIAIHAQENTTIGEQASQQATNVLYDLGIDYDKTYEERIGRVTLEDVQAAAKKYLGGNCIQVTTSNLEKPTK